MSIASSIRIESGTPSMALKCVVCGDEMTAWIDSDIWRCRSCSHWSSTLHANPVSAEAGTLNEAHRIHALKELRIANAASILSAVREHLKKSSPSLCDIGSAYGWFLESAQTAGFDSIGIEPDQHVAASAIERGLPIRIGYFPKCLLDSEQFDVLIFNDVFEHLADPDDMVIACRHHLREDGLLVIVLPSSEGVIFRLSRFLRKLGVQRPWDRLWQRDFPCPHVHYYSRHGLQALVSKHAFRLEQSRDLPSLHLTGLWHRISMDNQCNPIRAIATYAVLVLLYPVLRLCRSDATLQIFRSAP